MEKKEDLKSILQYPQRNYLFDKVELRFNVEKSYGEEKMVDLLHIKTKV